MARTKYKVLTFLFVAAAVFVNAFCVFADSNVKEWGTITNRIVEDSQPDLNSSFLMKKANGYKCYNIDTKNNEHLIECLKVTEGDIESFDFRIYYNIDGYMTLMEASCFYVFPPNVDVLNKAFNEAVEAFLEGNSDIKNYNETEDIARFIDGAEKYKAFETDGVIHVFAINDEYLGEYKRIVHYAFRPEVQSTTRS